MAGVFDYRGPGMVCLRILGLALVPVLLVGQEGMAPSGRYPPHYQGLTFTGRLQSVDKDKQEFTLVYSDKGEERIFVGRLERGCDVPSTQKDRKMNVEDIPLPSTLTAFYAPASEKQGDKKVKVNYVIAIVFHEFSGRAIAQRKQSMFRCTNAQFNRFKCLRGEGAACLEQ